MTKATAKPNPNHQCCQIAHAKPAQQPPKKTPKNSPKISRKTAQKSRQFSALISPF